MANICVDAITLASGAQCVVPRPATSESSGNIDIQVLKYQHRPTILETLSMGLTNLY